MEPTTYSLEDIKKNPFLVTPDWKKWLYHLQNEPFSTGWVKAADKPISKKYKDTRMVIYTKKIDNDPLKYVRTEMTLKGVELEKYLAMMSNRDIRRQWDKNLMYDEIVLKLPNGNIGYRQMKMPAFMSNRDGLSKYLMFSNKKNPDLVEKCGLPKRNNKYYVICIEPIRLKEYPKRKDFERSTMFMIMIAEETDEPGVIKTSQLIHMDLGGWVPDWIMNSGAVKFQFKMMKNFLKHYSEFDKQSLLVLKDDL